MCINSEYRSAVRTIATTLRRRKPDTWRQLKATIRWSNVDATDTRILAYQAYHHAATRLAMQLPDATKLAIVPSGDFSESAAAGIATAVSEELLRRADIADRHSC